MHILTISRVLSPNHLLPSLTDSWHLPSSTIALASLRRQGDRHHHTYNHQAMHFILYIRCFSVKNATLYGAIAV